MKKSLSPQSSSAANSPAIPAGQIPQGGLESVDFKSYFKSHEITLRTDEVGLGGANPKFATKINGTIYHIKEGSHESPINTELEYVSNLIARSLGIDVPDFAHTKLSNGKPVFISKDFLNAHSGGAYNLEHFSSHFDSDKSNWTVESIIATITKHSSSPRDDVSTFIKVCIFDALIGNQDRHRKNLAFIRTPSSLRLSPIYDNISWVYRVADSSKLDQGLPCDIRCGGQGGRQISDYIREFRRLGYGPDVDRVTLKINKIDFQGMIKRSGVKNPLLSRLIRHINGTKGEL